MRCPKCGAFMEEGKDVCFMCGINVKTYVPDNNTNNFNRSNDTAFGSGASFNNNSDFGSGSGFSNPSYNQMKDNYLNNKNNYRNVELKPVKNGEKDMFDFFSENKSIVRIISVIGVAILLVVIGVFYYKSKTKEVPLTPVFNNLYFEVDDTLQQVGNSSNNGVVFNKSGNKGTDCSITIAIGTSTSGDHVKDWFTTQKAALEPEKDSSGNVVDELKIYTAQESSLTLNDASWHYMNIFYKKDKTSEPTQLRYKFMTSMYKGYYYDIILVNNSNDTACNASLDNFARSLKFVDSQAK
ncbi:MAG: hypothetical protein ACI4XM_07120 [Candidatus Coprovivens sp.]